MFVSSSFYVDPRSSLDEIDRGRIDYEQRSSENERSSKRRDSEKERGSKTDFESRDSKNERRDPARRDSENERSFKRELENKESQKRDLENKESHKRDLENKGSFKGGVENDGRNKSDNWYISRDHEKRESNKVCTTDCERNDEPPGDKKTENAPMDTKNEASLLAEFKPYVRWKTVWVFLLFVLFLLGSYTYWRMYAYQITPDEEMDTLIYLAVEQNDANGRLH